LQNLARKSARSDRAGLSEIPKELRGLEFRTLEFRISFRISNLGFRI